MMNDTSEQNEIPSSDEILQDQDSDVGAVDEGTDGENAESELDQLRQKLIQAEKELLRSHADMENFRRRTRKDNEDRIRYAVMPLVTELVEIVDNLNRAVESAQANESSEGLIEGVKMVSQQIADVLVQNGCQTIEAVGSAFDPNKHEAIRMEASEEFESNVVSQETRTGYTLHERVVRPAQVFVSTGPIQDEPTTDNE